MDTKRAERFGENYIYDVSFATRGETFLTCFASGMCALRTVHGEVVEEFEAHGRDATAGATAGVLSPDGNWIATAGCTSAAREVVRIWDRATLELLQDVEVTGVINVSHLQFAPDAGLVACATDAGVIPLVNATTGHIERFLRGHGGSTRCVRFSPDGSQLVSCGDDRTIRVWDVATGEIVQEAFVGTEVESMIWYNDHDIIWGGRNGQVCLHEVIPRL